MSKQPIEEKLSVRTLVEFLFRSGNLDNRYSTRDPEAMNEGARLHRKIQKAQPGFYRSEVPLLYTWEGIYEERPIAITIDGRADGIMTFEEDSERMLCMNPALTFSSAPVVIDEIKCILREVSHVKEPIPVHLAQAKVYAAIVSIEEDLPEIGVQLTYVQMDTERVKYFTEFYQREDLLQWFEDLCLSYSKWLNWQANHMESRDASIKEMHFPYPYRPGQFDLAASVYRTIKLESRLFIEAPTGVGKTLSTVFPAIKSMGEGLTKKLFYLTAKTITRTVAEDTFRLMLDRGLHFLPITITAKEKVCVLPKPDCNPASCPRAEGHLTRVNDAVFDLLETLTREAETSLEPVICTREMLLSFAEKHNVCPYEMSLDVALFMDAVICDYNYAFDPVVYFRRFFGEGGGEYVFLIDEAHNLVDRAREMYSAQVVKESLLAAKRVLKDIPDAKLAVKLLDTCNKQMLALKRECTSLTTLAETATLTDNFRRLLSAFDMLYERTHAALPEEASDLYFDLRQWDIITDHFDDHYRAYMNHNESGEFFVCLQCMDPSRPLRECLDKGRASIFFSATLLPINYYKSQLSGEEKDYAVYAESSFLPENRKVLIAGDVETRYSKRGEDTYRKIAEYIKAFVAPKSGNYIAFFPSYKMIQEVLPFLSDGSFTTLEQTSGMTETEKEEFLQQFSSDSDGTLLGLCVMGGIFSEGIDLRNDRLIGAVIVGPGLPQFCDERQLFRDYYEDANRMGFEYAYLYPGMNKVLQSAGRVIRTQEDRGAILLLDKRFTERQYQGLFPKEWYPYESVTLTNLSTKLQEFWSEEAAGKHTS